MSHLIRRLALFGALFLSLASGVRAAPAPNIVFFLVDDLDRALFEQMPRLRTMLTERGLRFDKHFVTVSLCCPSRSATLRGQFSVNSGIYGNSMPSGGFQLFHEKGLEQSTVATWLQNAGYRTALFGKYLNEYPTGAPSVTYIPPGWSEWYSPNDGNPYRSFDYTMNQNGKSVAYGSSSTDHITDVISRLSTDFIVRSTADNPSQPLFMYVAPYAPHGPATPPTRYANTAPGLQAPRTASFDEADVSDKPSWVQGLPRLGRQQIDDIDFLYRNRYRSMLGVEDLVADVLDTLKTQGRLDNTYIFFTSDNGFHQGQHRMESGKNSGFDEDLIVPLIVRGPDVPAKGSVSQLTANVDYAATIAGLAGIEAPSFVDGRSLVPMLRGKTVQPWRKALLLEHRANMATDRSHVSGPVNPTVEPDDAFDTLALDLKIGVFRGLRTGDGLTYLEYDNGEHELYDNVADPAQLTNVYDQASERQARRLSRWAGTLQGASGAALRSAEEKTPAP